MNGGINWQLIEVRKKAIQKIEKDLFSTIETLHNTGFDQPQERLLIDRKITELKMIYSKALLKY